MPIEVLIALGGIAFSLVSNTVAVTWVIGRINARSAESRARCDRIERDLEREEARALAALEREIARALAAETKQAEVMAAQAERLTTLVAQVHEIRNKITPRILEADVATAAAIAELRERITRAETWIDRGRLDE